MIRFCCSLIVLLACLPLRAFAADACDKGEKRLHPTEECIPKLLFNYLYCLEKSGGGRVEVNRRDVKDTSNDLEIRIGGKGAGVIVKGEGDARLKKEAS